MLPLGPKPLAVWSIEEALKNNLTTVVTTDIPELREISEKMGCLVVDRPAELATDGDTHHDAIKHALEQYGLETHPIILFQPTSPFRLNGIVKDCLKAFEENPDKTILTVYDIHHVKVSDTGLERGNHETLWDGNIAIYPVGKVGDFSNIKTVKNYHVNTIQIDTEEDYIQACVLAQTLLPVPAKVLLPDDETRIVNVLKSKGLGLSGKIQLIVRPTKSIPSQSIPCVYVNHCLGYTGGRVDAVFLIANKQLRSVGVSDTMRECVKRARVVLIRNNGEHKWLLDNLPELGEKSVLINQFAQGLDNHMTTGVIAVEILSKLGEVIAFGFSQPKDRANVLLPFHAPTISREIAILKLNISSWLY